MFFRPSSLFGSTQLNANRGWAEIKASFSFCLWWMRKAIWCQQLNKKSRQRYRLKSGVTPFGLQSPTSFFFFVSNLGSQLWPIYIWFAYRSIRSNPVFKGLEFSRAAVPRYFPSWIKDRRRKMKLPKISFRWILSVFAFIAVFAQISLANSLWVYWVNLPFRLNNFCSIISTWSWADTGRAAPWPWSTCKRP